MLQHCKLQHDKVLHIYTGIETYKHYVYRHLERVLILL